MTTRLSGTGIWSSTLRYGDADQAAAVAAELEGLGYSALWIPDVGGDLFGAEQPARCDDDGDDRHGHSQRLDAHPDETAAEHARLTAEHGPRFLCGIGISHRPLIDHANEPGTYQQADRDDGRLPRRPRRRDPPLAPQRSGHRRARPEMLELARTRTAGTHPYLVTPELTDKARAGIGPDGLVASEQGVVMETDPTKAREIARMHLSRYLDLPNYSNNWKRQGFTDDDLAGGGSDRLVDALVVWGDEATIAARVQEHRDAGADHVCIQVLTDDPRAFPVDQWRALAPALT